MNTEAALVEEVRERLARDSGEVTPHRVAEALRASGRPVGDATVLAVHEALRRDVVGAGPLEPLLRTPDVTDVLVNGAEQVYLDRGPGSGAHRRRGSPTRNPCGGWRSGWPRSGGRRLDDATPYVDVRLARRHPLPRGAGSAGPARHGAVAAGSAPTRPDPRRPRGGRHGHPSTAPACSGSIVARRLAFLVSGGTGSGKTTLLSTLLSRSSTPQRLVLVEDASELRPDHPHVVGLEARPTEHRGRR